MRKWMMVILALSTTTTVARAQDATAGQNSFTMCAICHAVGDGAQNKLGPILNGLDGRRSASVAGFDYSDALKNAGITWSEARGAKPSSKSSSPILPRRYPAQR